MTKYWVRRDDELDMTFEGELLASVSSKPEGGTVKRWTELELYRTTNGTFVCAQIGRTNITSEVTRYGAQTFDTQGQVISFFGHKWLAKKLYAEAGFDAAEHVA